MRACEMCPGLPSLPPSVATVPSPHVKFTVNCSHVDHAEGLPHGAQIVCWRRPQRRMSMILSNFTMSATRVQKLGEVVLSSFGD